MDTKVRVTRGVVYVVEVGQDGDQGPRLAHFTDGAAADRVAAERAPGGAASLMELPDARMVHMPDGTYLFGERVFASRDEFDAARAAELAATPSYAAEVGALVTLALSPPTYPPGSLAAGSATEDAAIDRWRAKVRSDLERLMRSCEDGRSSAVLQAVATMLGMP